MTLKCRKCPYQSELYKMLTDTQLDAIDAHRVEMSYEAGEVIVKQGTSCTHVISFVDGLAKMHISTPAGRNLILRFIRPKEFIAATPLKKETRYRFSITAVEHTRICLIDVDVIRELVKQNKDFSLGILDHFHQHLLAMMNKLVSFYQKQHIGRLAESLLYLSDEVYRKNPMDLSITKSEIAELAGISKENCFRLMHSLQDDKIIRVNKRYIEILDRARLNLYSLNG
ncbi:MAG: Crp/Fnr family transcriptional regulator [Chlorobi bacterium]|nr:Crp/Fnr family transcriptional regulator [Chlorobiota bacterium]